MQSIQTIYLSIQHRKQLALFQPVAPNLSDFAKKAVKVSLNRPHLIIPLQ
jgi:hypothetical protein